MAMKILISIGEKWHKFLTIDENACKTVKDVKEFCTCRFPQVRDETELRIFWNDRDGDEISVITEADYRSFMLSTDTLNRTLYVEAKNIPQKPMARPARSTYREAAYDVTRPMHDRACDICSLIIVGHRYRCLTCHSFDVCMSCEAKFCHKDHIMLRIPHALRSRTQSQRVFDKLERYAARLELKAIDSSVGGAKKKNTTAGNTTEKGSSKSRRQIGVEARSTGCASYHHCHKKAREVSPNTSDVRIMAKNLELSKRVKSFSFVPNGKKKEKDVGTKHGHTSNRSFSPITPRVRETLEESSTSTAVIAETIEQAKAGNITPPAGPSVVAGLVDGVLKHTPPELKKFLPSENEMIQRGEKLSNLLLHHLKLGKNLQPTETAEPSSSSLCSEIVSKNTAEEVDENQDVDPVQAVASTAKPEEKETVMVGTNETLEATTSSVVDTSLGRDDSVNETKKVKIIDMDESAAETSSASMLTDDDEDVMDAAQVSNVARRPEASPSRPEVPWIMVDLPAGVEKEGKQSEVNTSSEASTSSVVASAITPSDAEKEDTHSSEAKEAEALPKSAELAGNALNNVVELLKQLTREPTFVQTIQSRLAQNYSYKELFEKAAEELKKHLQEVQVNGEIEQQPDQKKEGTTSDSKPGDVKDSMPHATSSPASPTKIASTSGPQCTIDVVLPTSSIQTYRIIPYSRRPHVNDAIKSMMAMGFSNLDGRLTKLLEALNGDIPRALDKLIKKVP